MKLNLTGGATLTMESSPSRGTWIEIEIIEASIRRGMLSSPSRGTWIEIIHRKNIALFLRVVPLTGDVD